jgi:hypothetical protein
MQNNNDDLLIFLNKVSLQKQIDRLASKHKDKNVYLYGGGNLLSIIFNHFDLSKLPIKGIADKNFTNDSNFVEFKTLTPEHMAISLMNLFLKFRFFLSLKI